VTEQGVDPISTILFELVVENPVPVIVMLRGLLASIAETVGVNAESHL
jgi:hypothetical protein